MAWQCFEVDVEKHVAHLRLNRPDKLNSMVPAFWRELPQAIDGLEQCEDVRVLLISSKGKHFTAGMDLSVFAGLAPDTSQGQGRARAQLMQLVARLQQSFSCLANARFPVIAAVQGGCIGGGVDMVSACDIRFASQDAFFTIHEINLAMTADLGTFPRLQRLIPDGVARELAFTGDRLFADRAQAIGLVNGVLPDAEQLLEHCRDVASRIAAKSPLAVWGSKRILNFAQDHSTADTLDQIAVWQAGMLDLDDMRRAVMAQKSKEEATFAGLPNDTPLAD